MKLPVTAIILTLNEENNLEAALQSVADSVAAIFVVDSFSTDGTVAIARKYTTHIYTHPFKTYADQLNWALTRLPITTEYVMRLDADERWPREALRSLSRIIETEHPDGVYIKRKIYFMGRWIRYGDVFSTPQINVFKKDKGRFESRWMDEHARVDGRCIRSDIAIIEANYDRQKNIALWIRKHNRYSTREAVDILTRRHGLGTVESMGKISGNPTERKRWFKENLYYVFPPFIRSICYYLYRYVFRLGFLDGKEGFVYHFLHALWYRFLVDVKISQIEKRSLAENKRVQEIIEEFLASESDFQPSPPLMP